MIGVGNIGSAVLRQLHQQRDYLLSKGFDVKVVGLANSKRFVVDAERRRTCALERRCCMASPTRMDPRRVRASGLGGAAADERRAGRLHRGAVDCRRLSGVHRREPAHHHAEQVGERAAVARGTRR